MRISNGIESYPPDAQPVVATIGNYDGLHLGHREILRRVTRDARRRGVPSLLISFEPHPLEIVAPERKPKLLQTRRQKLEQFEAAGLDRILLLRFDERVAALSGRAFFQDLLLPRLGFSALHVGENFRFGHDRQGDLALLCQVGAEHGFEVHGVPPVRIGDEPVSSSAIRAAIELGDVERARRMLGRPYPVTGEVVRGEGRGRSLQCPTANVEVENELVPGRGVYVTETLALASRFPSVTNVGVRPTFGSSKLTVETHLLDFDDELYHERVEVLFLARLRDEMRFAGASELADQLARDRAAAEAFFQHQQPGPD